MLFTKEKRKQNWWATIYSFIQTYLLIASLVPDNVLYARDAAENKMDYKKRW